MFSMVQGALGKLEARASLSTHNIHIRQTGISHLSERARQDMPWRISRSSFVSGKEMAYDVTTSQNTAHLGHQGRTGGSPLVGLVS